MKPRHLLEMAVVLLPISLALSCAQKQCKILSQECGHTAETKPHVSEMGKGVLSPTIRDVTNSPKTHADSQPDANGNHLRPGILNGEQIVEIVRREIERVAPSAKTEFYPPEFSGGKWMVHVAFLPFRPGHDVSYELSPSGQILGRRHGY